MSDSWTLYLGGYCIELLELILSLEQLVVPEVAGNKLFFHV